MKAYHRVKLFLALDVKTMGLFLEAYFHLGVARLLISLPFAKITPLLGVQMQETSEVLAPTSKKAILRVQEAVEVMSRHTFWESRCLVQAMAAMKMLQRRKIESTLYLGTGKNKQAQLTAHAWLRSGYIYVTGAAVMDQYTVIGKFAQWVSDSEGE